MSADLVDRLLSLLGADGVLGLGEPTHGSASAFAALAFLPCSTADVTAS